MNSANFHHTFCRRLTPCRALLMLAVLWSPAAFTASNPDSHQHGEARLQLAFESNRIDLIMTSPAYNLVGFEHAARSEEEKRALTDASDWLKTNPLMTPANGACQIVESEVDMSGSLPASVEHSHHGHSHHDDQHRDHEVSQTLECDDVVAGGMFSSLLMTRFPAVRTLVIEWVGESGQGSGRLRSPDDQVELGAQ